MAEKYQAYPVYKDSGVEWSELIPKHWDLTKAAWNFHTEKGKNGQLLTKEYFGDNSGGYPVYSGQTDNDGIMGQIDTYEFDFGNEGVLFSTTVGAKAMHLRHLYGRFSLSQNCMIIVPKSNLFYTRFSYYQLQPIFIYERKQIPEHMQPSFRMEDFYQFKLITPPFHEQTQIAKFLDDETAKIDTLIEKQQQLIQLLKEKRQAVISHAVTKGLNQDVPMKNSGVEWIGNIPEHWNVAEIRRITLEHRQGYYSEKGYDEAGHRVVRITDILEQNIIDVSNSPFFKMDEENRDRYELRKGDFLFQRTGSHKKIGIFNSNEPSVYASFLIRFRFNNRMNQNFLLSFFNSKSYKDQLNEQIHGGVNPNIHAENIKVCKFTIPPIGEQKSIERYIQGHLTKFHQLILKAELAIQLIKERRTALISAAVTGKIDVRNWHPPEHSDQTKTNKEKSS